MPPSLHARPAPWQRLCCHAMCAGIAKQCIHMYMHQTFTSVTVVASLASIGRGAWGHSDSRMWITQFHLRMTKSLEETCSISMSQLPDDKDSWSNMFKMTRLQNHRLSAKWQSVDGLRNSPFHLWRFQSWHYQSSWHALQAAIRGTCCTSQWFKLSRSTTLPSMVLLGLQAGLPAGAQPLPILSSSTRLQARISRKRNQ